MTAERWQQIKKLFESALERDAGQRAGFLEERCAGDPSLKRELESLIAHHERASGFIGTSALEILGKALKDDHTATVIGRRVGPYRIVREIGRGGMGAVYLSVRADDEYRKQVAIKVVKRGMDTDAMLRRFRNERQILADLDHRDIAKLLDGGTTEDGLSYLVMEYVEGLPIDVYCDARGLATHERLKLFCAVCSAVQYAHQHQVVHRDLKPSNILVAAEGVPKLLDFGIAKLLDPGLSVQTVEPTVGLRAMTPQYASPEQVRGETITLASDIYSLGVLLYELLTGHRPYHLRGGMPPQEAERIICEHPPPKPSEVISRVDYEPAGSTSASESKARDAQPEKLRRELRGDLDNIVLMALRKEPERRYASVKQFSEDIQRHLDGLPVIARRDTLAYRGAKFIKRNKASAVTSGITALIFLALISVGGFLPTSRNQEKGQTIQSLAVLPLENLSGDAEQDYFADGMTEALINDLAQIGALRVISRASAMQFKGAHQAVPEIARQLKVDAVVEGSVLRSGDKVRIRTELIQAATDRHLWGKTYERDRRDILALQGEVASAIAQEIKVKLSPEEQIRLARNRPVVREAHEAYLKGRFFWNKRTPDGLKKAIEFFQQAIERDPGYASAYAGLADCYILLPAIFIAALPPKDAVPRAKEAALKALEIDDTLAEAHTSLAEVKLYDWDWLGAEKEFKRAISLNPNYATAHHWYAYSLAAMGRLEEAAAEEQRAKGLDPLSLIINSWAGLVFYYARQYDGAIEQCGKTLEMDPSFLQAHLCLVLAYQQKGMYAEALAEAARAVTLSGGNPPALARLGYGYALAAKRSEAMKILDELQELSKRKYVSPYWRALIYQGLGEKDQAFKWLEMAYQERATELISIKVQPEIDSLRSDQRFGDLLRRMAFPP